MCIEDRERKKIDQQEEILLDEAIRMSLIQNDDTYLDNQLIEEQQKLFEQADQDYIDQIIQMSIVDQSQNPFLNLKNEQESSSEDGGNISPQSESQNIENVLMSQEDQQQKFDKYTQDEKEIVDQIEKINQNLDQLNDNDSQNIILWVVVLIHEQFYQSHPFVCYAHNYIYDESKIHEFLNQIFSLIH